MNKSKVLPTELKVTASESVERAVAEDLQVPDPDDAIARAVLEPPHEKDTPRD